MEFKELAKLSGLSKKTFYWEVTAKDGEEATKWIEAACKRLGMEIGEGEAYQFGIRFFAPIRKEIAE